MEEHHTIKDRVKPPFHRYSPPHPPPDLPKIETDGAVNICLSKNKFERHIDGFEIHSLRQIVTALLETDSLPQDFDEVFFKDVVIEEADLTELVIPFKLHFLNAYFLDGLHLNHSSFTMLTVSGYVGDTLSLSETKGQPTVSLGNLQADQIYVYGGEGLDSFEVSNSTIGRLTVSTTTIKRDISLHDSVDILDGLWLADLSVGHGINLWRCTIREAYFRIHNVSCVCNMEIEVCNLQAPLSTRVSSCMKLSLNESKCSGRLDFRNLSFQEIDVANTTVTGQLLFNLEQLQLGEHSRHRLFRLTPRGWDIPPRLSPQHTNTLREPITVAEQLIVLHKNFLKDPTAEQQERYCAYHLMNATWGQPHPSGLDRFTRWVSKWGFGYLLLPWRILRTMVGLIMLFTLFYVILIAYDCGNLAFSGGKHVFQDGVLCGVGRCLYFSVVTFSTLGYGDIHPVSWLKPVATIEALTGLVVTAVFAVSWARRLFRW